MLFYTKYNYKFKVEKSLTIKLPFTFNNFTHPYIKLINGNLTINIGYAWDGASGPVIDTKNTLIASLVHDALYQAMRLNLIPNNEATRKLADKTFYSILKDNGVFAIRRSVWYFAVRVFGRFFYKKKQGNDVILHS